MGNDKADIRCNAKESLSYCYAKSPEGVIHWGKNEGLHLGQCKIQVKFEMRDNGTWICGMGVEGYTTGYEDLKVPINVYVYGKDINEWFKRVIAVLKFYKEAFKKLKGN